MKLAWGKPNERLYHQGLDRGVLYRPGKPPVAWNGITSFNEDGEGGGGAMFYRDGLVYLSDVEPSDFKGSLSVFTWPEEFSETLGMPQVTDGFFVDNQKPKRFSFSYRTLVGSGMQGDLFGYQIHLVYNAVPSIGSRTRKTMNRDPEIVEFNFDLVCTPVRLPGYRPTAHYIIDTRYLSAAEVTNIENILYGTPTVDGRLPEPSELYDLMHFGDTITFTEHEIQAYGETWTVWTASGAFKNVHMTSDDTWEILNVNGVSNGDVLDSYTLSDTP